MRADRASTEAAAGAAREIGRSLRHQARWTIAEILFWLAAAATLFLLPERHLILNEIAIIGLFALSLDLILGYAGIVSLGHAAFFGLGAYTAGLLAKYGWGDPLLGLMAAAITATILGFATSFLVLRGVDLTRLMVTLGLALVLGEIANQAAWLTGGADGLQGVVMSPILGIFEFDIFGRTAYAYSLAVTFVLFLIARRIVASPFGLSLRAIRDNPLRAPRHRDSGEPPSRRDLYAGGRLCGHRRRAARTDHAVRLPRRGRLPPLGGRPSRSRHRRRRLSVRRLYRRHLVQGLAGRPVWSDATVLAVLDRRHSRRHCPHRPPDNGGAGEVLVAPSGRASHPPTARGGSCAPPGDVTWPRRWKQPVSSSGSAGSSP